MEFENCKDAKRWLSIDVICGKDCPVFANCPRLIMEDATDKAVGKAMEAMTAMKENVNGK